MDKSITIIGCGWMGLPLGKRLLKRGWQVKGTTTRSDKVEKLRSVGIEPYCIKLPSKEGIPADLFKSQYLVLNIPPGRKNPRMAAVYPGIIENILQLAKDSTIEKIIFVSSTSVYGSKHKLLTEDMATEPKSTSGKSLLMAEDKIKASGKDWLILRFGGLAGPERHPGRFLSGRKGLISGDQVINYLHLEDAIGVIEYLMGKDHLNQVYNVVSPVHPLKRVFYPAMAKQINVEHPVFTDEDKMFKREVSVSKLISETGYQFKYPDPMYYEY